MEQTKAKQGERREREGRPAWGAARIACEQRERDWGSQSALQVNGEGKGKGLSHAAEVHVNTRHAGLHEVWARLHVGRHCRMCEPAGVWH